MPEAQILSSSGEKRRRESERDEDYSLKQGVEIYEAQKPPFLIQMISRVSLACSTEERKQSVLNKETLVYPKQKKEKKKTGNSVNLKKTGNSVNWSQAKTLPHRDESRS